MTAPSKPAVLITGISGNLGLRVLKQLQDFSVIGCDITPPRTDLALQFERMDLGSESSCRHLVTLLRDTHAQAVVHLAFVLDPLRSGVLDPDRMWQINVAGSARVMEAITEVNRTRTGGQVETFVFPSSVSVYGPNTHGDVKEDHPLGAHTLPYAIHKQECDDVVRYRAQETGNCTTFLLRPHILTGPTVQNYMVGALRGTPTGKGKRADKMRENGKRLPLLLPYGDDYLHNRLQFLHVDDMARLIAHILRKPAESKNGLVVMNVAGRGNSLTVEQCAHIANAHIKRLPGKMSCRIAMKLMWDLGISGAPPESFPYMIGSYTMETSKLKKFLGNDYEQVIRFTCEDALKECFRSEGELADSVAH